jgi:hypothetical protein
MEESLARDVASASFELADSRRELLRDVEGAAGEKNRARVLNRYVAFPKKKITTSDSEHAASSAVSTAASPPFQSIRV